MQTRYRWDKSQHDCAGFVRYVFAEALAEHPESFRERYPAVRALARPAEPGELRTVRIFWLQNNTTLPGLLTKFRFMSRDLAWEELKTGDILYFESAELKIRHIMLVVRPGKELFLVYHTGDERDKVLVRTPEDLIRHEQPHWHPNKSNPAFRGYYRPEFLD